jgi:NTE family protein
MDINNIINNDLFNLIHDNNPIVNISPEYDIPIYKSTSIKINNKNILILSGGGIKGIAHIGALQALEDLGYLNQFNVFASASVGTFIIILYIAGYSPKEMWEFVQSFNLDNLKQLNIFNIFTNYGMDNGDRMIYVIQKLLEAKGHNPNITLKELYEQTNKKLLLSTVCLNKQEVCYLSHDTHPYLPVYQAIRMSTSLPLFFEPVIYDDMYYIDGGCIDNYPIHLFDEKLDKVLGLHLGKSNNFKKTINNFEEYLLLVMECFMRGVEFNTTRGYSKPTIRINFESINLLNFHIDNIKKKQIYDKGYIAVKDYYN